MNTPALDSLHSLYCSILLQVRSVRDISVRDSEAPNPSTRLDHAWRRVEARVDGPDTAVMHPARCFGDFGRTRCARVEAAAPTRGTNHQTRTEASTTRIITRGSQHLATSLFSVIGVGSGDEQRRRTTSALILTMQAVPLFARAITSRVGAPA